MTKITTRTCGINSRAEFEEKINEIASLDVELRSLTAEMDAKLQAVRDQYADRIEAKTTYRNSLFADCDSYASKHQELVLKRGLRSGETALARYGFHLGNPQLVLLNRKHKWATVLEAIRARGSEWVSKYISTKTTSAANKDALKADLSDAQLAEIGCRVEQTDSFYIDAKDDNSPEA